MLAKHFEFFLGTAVAVVLLTSLPGRFSAVADQQPSPVLPTPYPAAEIALVDMAAIFAVHPKFIAETTAMKADAKRIDGSLLECVQSVAKLQLELSQSEQGTPEHADLARRVTRTNAEINADRTKLVQEFKQREALVCRSSYQEHPKADRHLRQSPGDSDRLQARRHPSRDRTGRDHPKPASRHRLPRRLGHHGRDHQVAQSGLG
jgi:hypothetical protein